METLQVPSELAPIIALYRERKPRRVLEIGCWDGGTLKHWLEGCGDNATVVAVDLAHRNPEAYPGWTKPDTELIVIEGDSLSDRVIEQIQKHGPYDWVFIDGDHGMGAVRKDFETCLPLVNPGGHLLLHDIEPPGFEESYPPGVLFDELRAKGYDCEAFVEKNGDPWSHGIGLVRL